MKCPNCGAIISPGEKFCTKCGAPAAEKPEKKAGGSPAKKEKPKYRLSDFDDRNIPGSGAAIVALCLCFSTLFLETLSPVAFIIALLFLVDTNTRGFHSAWLKAAVIVGVLGSIKGVFDFFAFIMPRY